MLPHGYINTLSIRPARHCWPWSTLTCCLDPGCTKTCTPIRHLPRISCKGLVIRLHMSYQLSKLMAQQMKRLHWQTSLHPRINAFWQRVSRRKLLGLLISRDSLRGTTGHSLIVGSPQQSHTVLIMARGKELREVTLKPLAPNK